MIEPQQPSKSEALSQIEKLLAERVSTSASVSVGSAKISSAKLTNVNHLEIEHEKENVRTHQLDNDSKENDNSLKKHYGYGLLSILAIQLLAMNVIFICYGIGTLSFEVEVLNLLAMFP